IDNLPETFGREPVESHRGNLHHPDGISFLGYERVQHLRHGAPPELERTHHAFPGSGMIITYYAMAPRVLRDCQSHLQAVARLLEATPRNREFGNLEVEKVVAIPISQPVINTDNVFVQDPMICIPHCRG